MYLMLHRLCNIAKSKQSKLMYLLKTNRQFRSIFGTEVHVQSRPINRYTTNRYDVFGSIFVSRCKKNWPKIAIFRQNFDVFCIVIAFRRHFSRFWGFLCKTGHEIF